MAEFYIFDAAFSAPPLTSAFCLIICERLIRPLSDIIHYRQTDKTIIQHQM